MESGDRKSCTCVVAPTAPSVSRKCSCDQVEKILRIKHSIKSRSTDINLLALPSKRYALNSWKQSNNVLAPEMIEHLKGIVHGEYMGVNLANCKRQIKKRPAKKCKCQTKTIKNKVDNKRCCQGKSEGNSCSLVSALLKKINTYDMKRESSLTCVIFNELCCLMDVDANKPREPRQRSLIAMAKKFSIWIKEMVEKTPTTECDEAALAEAGEKELTDELLDCICNKKLGSKFKGVKYTKKKKLPLKSRPKPQPKPRPKPRPKPQSKPQSKPQPKPLSSKKKSGNSGKKKKLDKTKSAKKKPKQTKKPPKPPKPVKVKKPVKPPEPIKPPLEPMKPEPEPKKTPPEPKAPPEPKKPPPEAPLPEAPLPEPKKPPPKPVVEIKKPLEPEQTQISDDLKQKNKGKTMKLCVSSKLEKCKTFAPVENKCCFDSMYNELNAIDAIIPQDASFSPNQVAQFKQCAKILHCFSVNLEVWNQWFYDIVEEAQRKISSKTGNFKGLLIEKIKKGTSGEIRTKIENDWSNFKNKLKSETLQWKYYNQFAQKLVTNMDHRCSCNSDSNERKIFSRKLRPICASKSFL